MVVHSRYVAAHVAAHVAAAAALVTQHATAVMQGLSAVHKGYVHHDP